VGHLPAHTIISIHPTHFCGGFLFFFMRPSVLAAFLLLGCPDVYLKPESHEEDD